MNNPNVTENQSPPATSVPASGSSAAIADALDAVLAAVHSLHTSMAFTPHFARHHLEQDAAFIRKAGEKIETLRRQNDQGER